MQKYEMKYFMPQNRLQRQTLFRLFANIVSKYEVFANLFQ